MPVSHLILSTLQIRYYFLHMQMGRVRSTQSYTLPEVMILIQEGRGQSDSQTGAIKRNKLARIYSLQKVLPYMRSVENEEGNSGFIFSQFPLKLNCYLPATSPSVSNPTETAHTRRVLQCRELARHTTPWGPHGR